MCLYGLVFAASNNFVLQFENVWKVKEVEESASRHREVHLSLPEAVLTEYRQFHAQRQKGKK